MRVLQSVFLFSAMLILTSCATHFKPTVSTGNPHAQRIAQAMPKYIQLAKQPWPVIHFNGDIRGGESNHYVPMIRNRLIQLGDLSLQSASISTVYDRQLQEAIMRFQWRHGLKADGKIGGETLQALNVSPRERLRQLEMSMQRWAKLPEHIGNRYIQVNIPNYELNVIENGKQIMAMRVIVGRPSRPTPEIFSKVQTLVFNPQWNIPDTIMKKDIIPKVLHDKEYLQKNNIKIYSSWDKNADSVSPGQINWERIKEQGTHYRLTQAPGDLNALGRVKFIFLNNQDIYLHDTPQKELFAQAKRAYSSGCIRVEKPFELVDYFIKDDPDMSEEKVNTFLSEGKIKYISIKKPIPIYITYITAWADEQGRVHFREDIYSR